MSVSAGAPPAAEAPKVSRYRSLRGAVSAPGPVKPPADEGAGTGTGTGGGSLRKSVFGSRYRRRPPKADEAFGAAAGAPPMPAQAGRGVAAVTSPDYAHAPDVLFTTTIQAAPPQEHGAPPRRLHKAPPVASAMAAIAGAGAAERPYPAGAEAGWEERAPRASRESRRAEGGDGEAGPWAAAGDEGQAREAERLLAEQKRKDLERLQAQLEAATQRSPPAQQPQKPKSPVLERFSFLTRRSKPQPQPQPSPLSPPPAPAPKQGILGHRARPSDPARVPRKSASAEPIGRAVAVPPPADVPISASNAGERSVLVRCRQSSFSLAVVPDTTVVDVLFQCSDMMKQPINTATGIVMEHYGPLGLERRLRRYERIRDVLNSWDRDAQNSLLVLPSDASERDQDLDLAAVPRTREPPGGLTLQLYHSNRPGRWSKRYVTLLGNGQLLSSRKPAPPGPSDRDAASLCHLSDFDIYAPTEAQMRKHLKPPKRHCYAVKSQQRTTLFESQDRFVHFFCTEDARAAQQFYAAVHGWRSWYLVNRKMQGAPPRKAGGPPSAAAAAAAAAAPPPPDAGYRPDVASDAPGSRAHAPPGRDRPSVEVSREAAAAGGGPPPARHFSRPSRDIHSTLVRRPGRAPSEAREFSATGLLGDAYDERKREAGGDDARDGPFTEGPSLLNRKPSAASRAPAAAPPADRPEPAGWFPSAVEHSARANGGRRLSLTGAAAPPPQPPLPSSPLPPHHHHHHHHSPHHYQQQQRPATAGSGSGSSAAAPNSSEKRSAAAHGHGHGHGGKPEPLLSFEPEFKEAPQWSREGRGRGVHAPAGVPLVDLAGSRWQQQQQHGAQDDAELAAATQRLVRRELSSARRPTTSAGPGPGRGRAATLAGGRGDVPASAALPPMPLLQGLAGGEDAGSRAFPLMGGGGAGAREAVTRGRSGTMR